MRYSRDVGWWSYRYLLGVNLDVLEIGWRRRLGLESIVDCAWCILWGKAAKQK